MEWFTYALDALESHMHQIIQLGTTVNKSRIALGMEKEMRNMEKYLKEQYNVFEDDKCLTKESEIVDYFKDCGSDYLDCGQGYYQDETELICKIDDKFYAVKAKAEIGSAKQDVGDRLYWVDRIKSVTYREIEKPQPKNKVSAIYNLNITEDQKRYLECFMKENYIKF